MENRVDREVRRKLQSVRQFADVLDDFEGTESSMIELVRGTESRDVATEEPDEVSGYELRRDRGMMRVVVLGHLLFRILELILEFVPCTLKRFDAEFGSRDQSRPSDCERMSRVEPVVSEKRRDIARGGARVVQSELSEGQQRMPIILMIGDEVSEIRGDFLIRPLGSSVCCWMVRRGGGRLDLEEFEQTSKELRDEGGTAVRNNFRW